MSPAGASIPPLSAAFRACCPRCGEGRLFAGYLRLRPRCDHCDLDFDFADSGDGPAVFGILIVGFIVVAGALYAEVVWQPPYWLHALIWLPLAVILSVAVLRPFKAGLIAQQYRVKARADDSLSG